MLNVILGVPFFIFLVKTYKFTSSSIKLLPSFDGKLRTKLERKSLLFVYLELNQGNAHRSSVILLQLEGTPDNGDLWQRVNSQLASPSQPYSLREALAQAQSSRIGASAQALRESLHPILRQKLVYFSAYSMSSLDYSSFFLAYS